jgi:hypothetical protein
MHFKAEDWRLITPTTTIKNCFANCGFPSDHVSSNKNALKLTEGEENDWCSLKPLGVQFEEYATHNSALKYVESTLSTRYLTSSWPGQKMKIKRKKKKEEEKARQVFDTVKGLEAATKLKVQTKMFPVQETPG